MALSIRRLDSFWKDYQELPEEGKVKVEKALKLLIENPRHSSLQVKKIQGTPNLWEARVDLKRRMTFQLQGDRLVLRRIGSHDSKENRKKWQASVLRVGSRWQQEKVDKSRLLKT